MAVIRAVAATLLALRARPQAPPARRRSRRSARCRRGLLAEDGVRVLAAEGPAARGRLAARSRRNMPFAPADAPVAVAHLDDDRLELGIGPIGEHIRADQRQPHDAQVDFGEFHGDCTSATDGQTMRSSRHRRVTAALTARRARDRANSFVPRPASAAVPASHLPFGRTTKSRWPSQ